MYQYQDSNAWMGPEVMISHKHNTVRIHTNGDIKKVAACRVKPYGFIP